MLQQCSNTHMILSNGLTICRRMNKLIRKVVTRQLSRHLRRDFDMRKWASTILLTAVIFIGELHTFWEKGGERVQNWIWKIERPMPLQWNIKYLTDEVSWLLVSLAVFLYLPNRLNKTVAAAFVFYQLFSLAWYFYNFKTYGFGWIYYATAAFGFIAWYKVFKPKK